MEGPSSRCSKTLKWPYTWFQPLWSWLWSSPAHPGTWWETLQSTPPDPGLQTLLLSVKPEITMGLGFTPSQPQSRISPACPGIHPITRSSQGPGGNYLHVPANRLLPEDPAVETETDSSPNTRILNKVLEVVPYQTHQIRQNLHLPKPLVTSLPARESAHSHRPSNIT